MRAFRGTILDFTGDPGATLEPPPDAVRLLPDGVLVTTDDGHVAAVEPWRGQFDDVVDYSGKLILPGMIDTHVHYVQMDAIASHGEQVLQWLDRYVYPAEARFDDVAHAERVAGFFLDTLLAAGTTTAMVWSSTPKESAEGFFRQAHARDLRMITGKVVQDGSSHGGNQDDASVESARRDTVELIERWHGKGRLGYAVTPRFALTCSPAMLRMCGELLDEHDVWLQTHLSENLEEEAIVRARFGTPTYTQAYVANGGLLRERALFAHCCEINEGDRELFRAHGASIAFCPTSNFFLGSGTHNLYETLKSKDGTRIRVGLGTDCGAGTSYSILHTMGAAYQAQAMRAREYLGHHPPLTTVAPIEPLPGVRPAQGEPLPFDKLTAWRAFYLATLGGAEALRLEHVIGSFNVGNEADFVVLDFAATPVLKRRVEAAGSWHEKLFALMALGDERATHATYVLAKMVSTT
ncbi:guanine deaminase [Allorhizocola rhizosphaerae]|uniref:guanine deaminase n=1 Tax=Allorhizocola rhizosphaerae TaxID=1872709 RepID=UPI0013C33D60|nr:guanine deaminase [Allorhizocola rhizosphaerae]